MVTNKPFHLNMVNRHILEDDVTGERHPFFLAEMREEYTDFGMTRDIEVTGRILDDGHVSDVDVGALLDRALIAVEQRKEA